MVLYSGSNIVLFYGSNSWAYTRLGKIDLPEDQVTELLSNGDVVVRIRTS
ncbi:cyclophilin-like fold protein [Ruminococcus sp. 5_1_39BFAA]